MSSHLDYIPGSVAVTGAGGMLGTDVVRDLQRRQIACHALDRQSCDITSLEICREVLGTLRPSTIINCSGYTAVDKAETDIDAAFDINAKGAGNLALTSSEVEARLIHISTDYVFNGNAAEPYEPSAQTNPLNVYGSSKMAGEVSIAGIMPADSWTIVRTSWLFGAHGSNFVKKMLQLGRERKPVRVVNDQIGSPTYTADLASSLADLVARPVAGIVHVSSSGCCTWFEFAQAIFEYSGVKPVSLEPLATADFPTPAQRPLNSRLSTDSSIAEGVSILPDWRDGLRRYLQETGELQA